MSIVQLTREVNLIFKNHKIIYEKLVPEGGAYDSIVYSVDIVYTFNVKKSIVTDVNSIFIIANNRPF